MDTSRLAPGYRVLKSVGSGAAGTIYLAEGPGGERVALKVVNSRQPGGKKACEELNREYKILSRLKHPGIPRAHALHRTGEGLCMVRDYCSGTSLRNLIREDRREVARILPEILWRSGEMLQHMHDRGLVHRDFKPENLIVDDGGNVFLVDMALAWRKRLLGGKPALAGTPVYLAPELLGGGTPTPAADTYAYAVTAYELLAGRVPYEGRSREETLLAQRRGGAQPPSHRNRSVPPELDLLVMEGLKKDPSQRPRNVLVYAHKLSEVVARSRPAPAPK